MLCSDGDRKVTWTFANTIESMKTLDEVMVDSHGHQSTEEKIWTRKCEVTVLK